MPRKQREKSNTGIYHVILRGINKQNVFHDEEDYLTMMKILSVLHVRRNTAGVVTSSSDCDVYAVAILPNHMHILIRERDLDISACMKKLQDRYVFYHNKKYDRVGHLFQDRFRSETVDEQDYFFRLLRYIHRNPLKAMLCEKLEEYPYSSWREYIHNDLQPFKTIDNSYGLSQTDDKNHLRNDTEPTNLSLLFNSKISPEVSPVSYTLPLVWVCNRRPVLTVMPLDQLKEWVLQETDDKCMDMESERFVRTDSHAWDILSDLSGINNPEEFKQLNIQLQMHYILQAINKGVSVRAASRLSNCTYYSIRCALDGEVKDIDELSDNSSKDVHTFSTEGSDPSVEKVCIYEELTHLQKMTLLLCEVPRTSREILGLLNVSYCSRNLNTYITVLLEKNLLIRSIEKRKYVRNPDIELNLLHESISKSLS